MTDYRTSSGANYSFSGWNESESPLECWDRQDWLKCLHGCMLCLSLLNDHEATQRAIEDDGLLHELVHLESDINICLHGDMDNIRLQIEFLQDRLAAALLAELEEV